MPSKASRPNSSATGVFCSSVSAGGGPRSAAKPEAFNGMRQPPACHPERRHAVREAERVSESKDPSYLSGSRGFAGLFHQWHRGFPPAKHSLVLALAVLKLISFEDPETSMHRLTARLLLLLALAGYLVPIAMASEAPPHACCLRKIHRCQDSLSSESAQPVIRSASCCHGDCCRAVTTEQWAHAQARTSAAFMRHVEAYLGRSSPASPTVEVSSSQSTRAPPAC